VAKVATKRLQQPASWHTSRLGKNGSTATSLESNHRNAQRENIFHHPARSRTSSQTNIDKEPKENPSFGSFCLGEGFSYDIAGAPYTIASAG
jgi:hypothetical protein